MNPPCAKVLACGQNACDGALAPAARRAGDAVVRLGFFVSGMNDVCSNALPPPAPEARLMGGEAGFPRMANSHSWDAGKRVAPWVSPYRIHPFFNDLEIYFESCTEMHNLLPFAAYM